ncbi:HNH endonuclease family protein [Parafrigoribacterium soli]|uniref:HNH endonuclease family protein n=1 Tax=Parafrigoribacterium soli TaxID=3144663 RepID=UPI0032EDAC5C
MAPVVAAFSVTGAASGGFGGLLLAWGLIAIVTALYSLVAGRPGWASIPGRGTAAVVLAISLATMGVGASLLPRAGAATIPVAQPTPSPTQTVASTDTQPTPTPSRPPSPSTSVASPEGTALALLATLPVKGKSPLTGYDRTGMFGHAWLDVDHNGCDTRNDILQRDFASTVKSGPCKVMSGVLVSPYTGATINFVRGNTTSQAVQIDHVVALANAWQTGAQQLSQQQREELANDPVNLFAVDGRSNSQKGAGDTATWLPSAKSFRCTYVAHQISVKAKYGLWVTSAEHDAMSRILSGCPNEPAVASALVRTPAAAAPMPAPVPAPVAAPAPAAPAGCDPNYSGQCVPIASDVDCAGGSGNGPAYTKGPVRIIGTDIYQLDRDGDGIACD